MCSEEPGGENEDESFFSIFSHFSISRGKNIIRFGEVSRLDAMNDVHDVSVSCVRGTSPTGCCVSCVSCVRAPKAVVLAVLGPQRLLGAHAQACAAMVNI